MKVHHAFTGRPRQRRTSRSVWVAEILSRAIITIGGISTIVAVATVFLFLLYVVVPLFRPAAVRGHSKVATGWPAPPLQLGMDEDQLMVWALFRDGSIQLHRLETGELLDRRNLFEGPPLTAWSFPPAGEDAVFGFADGSVRTARIRFSGSLVDPHQLPEQLRELSAGERAPFKTGMVLRTPQGALRLQKLEVDVKDPAKPQTASPVLLIDQSKTTTGLVVCVLTEDGKLRLNTVREQKNLLTDQVMLKLTGIDLPYVRPAGKGPPRWLFLSAVGDQIYLFWEDGHLLRFDARDRSAPKVAESRNILRDPELRLTAIRCMIGKGTYLIGDSSGLVRAWFYTNQSDAGDGGQFVSGHEFASPGAAVTALAVSDRSRLAAVGYANGQCRLLHVTSEKQLADLSATGNTPVGAVVLAPTDDGLAALGNSELRHWQFDPRHPEITPAALFTKVWYEGYDRPKYVWQSSSGTDAFEPKFGLAPLIYGTLKASFYSLLFGVPLALLAAVYTSEFLHPRTKAVIKPTIELMASLPSVVLGFLAGLVFAQFVEQVVPAVLACLLTVPVAFLVGAYLWQLLPERVSLYLAGCRFLFVCLVLPAGLIGAALLGQLLERLMFAGNLRAWLDGSGGGSVGAWSFLLLPAAALVITAAMGQLVSPWQRKHTRGWDRRRTAALSLAKFVLAAVVTIASAWGSGLVLQDLGWDPRGSLVGPYSQRNALVVGFVMGFAIIPIVYTIAEDALSSVPEHLRSGSLATGATRWQTAVYIVIPTAMSGLFSAVMIGLGRAVGETMIVLMATGNTPVMDWSIFSGFRTLSATIAVELPEAVRGSTHEGTLYLAALVLFSITFVLNTAAEVVRLRFRRRAYQL